MKPFRLRISPETVEIRILREYLQKGACQTYKDDFRIVSRRDRRLRASTSVAAINPDSKGFYGMVTSWSAFFLRSSILLCILGVTSLFAQQKDVSRSPVAELSLQNEQVRCTVQIQGARLLGDRLETLAAWAAKNGGSVSSLQTDGDFGVDMMFTDWDAPGKANNAENLIVLTKDHFSYDRNVASSSADGVKELRLFFSGVGHRLRLMITYRLEPRAFYVKRSIALMDSGATGHFVRFFWPLNSKVTGVSRVVKDGGFGQPVAVTTRNSGAFFGLEYPASYNMIEAGAKGVFTIRCGEEFGERVGKNWIQSNWGVEGITPDTFVKLWFDRYVNDIRVAPLRPYSLYNSWYDLRSPEYPRWSKDNIMSEQTSFKMVDILRRNMIEKHGIKLDAFVLDDGWDVYGSDWVLRKEQWPNGLKPLSDELKKTGTSLGIWIGPTGGYSLRNLRLNWMKEHGYEIVNNMLCVGGEKYSALLQKRVSDFVQNDGVGYFKWDGIQFSCSEPNHGHPIDVYSRRAILHSVEQMCRTAREKNPGMFLNITSGTWMSPWWVKYSNTIWMQGADYGFADVPSISSRDGAITYRDFVLYEDWKLKGLWFPIANLMTHGIIKGKNFSVGTSDEPLDKFTDDVLLYFARGVSMYELYISPDILSDGEWTSISRSMAWARQNFDVLMTTELIGGNPMKGETYGYVHFKGARGIIAARNPVIAASKLKVELAVSRGLDRKAAGLVLQRVYPTRWTSTVLHKAGDVVTLPLEGFETAVYEVFPVGEATEPLIAGAVFDLAGRTGETWTVSLHSVSSDAKILNPSILKTQSSASRLLRSAVESLSKARPGPIVKEGTLIIPPAGTGALELSFTVAENATEGLIAVLLAQSGPEKKIALNVTAQLDGLTVPVSTEYQEGKSQWYKVPVTPGKHTLRLFAAPEKDSLTWKGKATVWCIARQKQDSKLVELPLRQAPPERLLPPAVWPAGEVRRNVRIGEVQLTVQRGT